MQIICMKVIRICFVFIVLAVNDNEYNDKLLLYHKRGCVETMHPLFV